MRKLVLATMLGLTTLVPTGPVTVAAADGLPVPVTNSPEGVPSLAGDVRYFAVPTRDETVLSEIEQDGGEVSRTSTHDGRYVVPAVAIDGSGSGLSADGGTLVLIRPRMRFPQQSTKLAVFDTNRLRRPELLTLKGDFSFDAISPDGSTLYFIEYLSRDPTDYAVRSYDLATGQLDPAPIVDADEPDEAMAGYPLTRESSPDGRWAYTLYDSPGHPFIHALDTQEATAQCIDLPETLSTRELYNAHLIVDESGSSLTVEGRSGPLAVVDTQTFAVGEPGEPAAPGTPADDGESWLLLAALGAGLLAIATAAIALLLPRRRAPAEVGERQAGLELGYVGAEGREGDAADLRPVPVAVAERGGDLAGVLPEAPDQNGGAGAGDAGAYRA